jgi:RHS repeat-associated protein
MKSVQRMGTTDYVFNYTYDLNGFQTSVQYPSGKTVYYAQSQRGLPMIAAKDAAGANAYASVGSYTPGGGMTQMNGSNGAFTQEWDYNSRGQMTRVEAKVGGSTQFKALLDYGSSGNNGNLLSQTITAGSSTFAQHFRYDAVNRLGLFVENPSGGSAPSDVNTTCASMSGSGTKCQKYGYDRFGNMWQSGANIALLDLVANGPGWYYNTAATPKVNNQLAFVGSAHDLAGNMVTYAPPSTALWAEYDVESRIAKLKVVNTGGETTAVEGEYFYDGEGLRIKKKAGNVTTVFVYDAGKQLMAEYEVGGTPVAGTKYLVADHLGSTRMLLDGSGAVVKRYDYVPFGGELARTGNSYDGVDAVKMKFTGKERDAERGLDFFEARYMASSQGRFTSPDPLSGEAGDPQSWNMFSYGRNNPLLYSDPDGMKYRICDLGSNCINDYPDVEFDRNVARDARDGKIYDKETVIGTYERLSFDDLSAYGNLFYGEMSRRREASNEMIAVAAGGSAAVGAASGAAVGTGAVAVVIDGVALTYAQLARMGSEAVAKLMVTGKLSMETVNQLRAYYPQLVTQAGNYLFARGGQGLLNGRLTGDYFRIGYGWNAGINSAVFRIAIGSARMPIHWHLDLWRR